MPQGSNRPTREEQAAQLAAELVLHASGAIDAGVTTELAHRARHVAVETIWLADTVRNERRLRKAMQAQRDEARALMLERLHGQRAAS